MTGRPGWHCASRPTMKNDSAPSLAPSQTTLTNTSASLAYALRSIASSVQSPKPFPLLAPVPMIEGRASARLPAHELQHLRRLTSHQVRIGAALTLSRISGSVFDARRLKRQRSNSRLTPSIKSSLRASGL